MTTLPSPSLSVGAPHRRKEHLHGASRLVQTRRASTRGQLMKAVTCRCCSSSERPDRPDIVVVEFVAQIVLSGTETLIPSVVVIAFG